MLVYDIEIVKGIAKKGEEKVPGIEYCAGWHDHANMGISVIGAYDYKEDAYRVFTDSNQDEFAKLVKSREIFIGFNNIRFDNKVIEACWGINIPEGSCYDILQKIWKAAGYGTEFNASTHTGYGLDACCRTNFGTMKTGHGALAPVHWQQGKIGNVIDYCINDVKMTKMLFDRILDTGYILNPKDPMSVLKLEAPKRPAFDDDIPF